MQKRKISIVNIVIFVIILLVLSACTQTGTGQKTPNTGYRSGSQGIFLKFTPNLPPSQIYNDQALDMLIEIENRGAAEVGFAGEKIYLSGYDPNILQMEPSSGTQQIPSLLGRTQYGPGELGRVSFKTNQINMNPDMDRFPVRFLVTACYTYETVASGTVCIDPDPYSAQQKVCAPNNINLGSQGAPISVSNIDVEPSKGKTRFRIDVQNVGGGDLFRYGTQYLSLCSPYSSQPLSYNELNYVKVEDVSVGGISILNSCNPALDSGHMRLINGRGSMYCTLSNIKGNTAYSTPINVKLRYGYRQNLFKDVTILQVR